jgi:hypothetical protein
VTNVNAEFMKQIGDRRGRAVIRRMAKYTLEELRDVRPRLVEASPRPSSVHLVYGEEMLIDRGYAEHLRDIDGVTLHPLLGLSEHSSAIHALLEGRLAGFIEMVAETNPENL